ncbi:MAG: radical SAM protein, partial [Candidatus Omnitrophica bacterium]|nr:radical SAM protein [Candidatus Omnitrophota bacterium]
MSDTKKIYFSWDIHYSCNFRCPYCWFYKDWASLAKRNLYLKPDEWVRHWRRVYDKYGEVRIEIVGGEPFIYPNFIELVKKISAFHRVKVTTNLSGDIERFVKEIDPARVTLDLNFHVLFIDLETVLKKAHILNDAGFNAGVCYLAYPPQMHKIKSLSERFARENIGFALAAFWGEYNGKKYPQSYTQQERDMMRPFLGDVDRIDFHLDGHSPKGKLCRAGQRYASIQADGKVVRCGPLGERAIGNITDDNFALLDRPMPCESDFCPCNEYGNIVEDESENKMDSPPPESPQEETALTLVSEVLPSTSVGPTDVLYPKLDPPFRVHWNWELGLHCNYKCSYCEVWPKGKEGKLLIMEPAEWKKIWGRMFEKYWCCHIRFSGGEPTIYPKFAELVSVLKSKHTVDITTNLSFDLKEFTKKVEPGGVSISASFHPEYNQIDDFLQKILSLHRNGYPSTIAYVAFPPHLGRLKDAKSLVEAEKVLFKIIPFKGEYQGRKYPDSYTPDEKALIEGMAKNSENSHLNDINSRWYDWNVKRQDQERQKKGKLCRMGQMYAKILPDGLVVRCCALDKDGKPLGVIGHITDLNLRLWDEPVECFAQNCPCFKGMLVGFEEEKWVPLWEGPEHPVYKIEDVRKAAQDKGESVNPVSTQSVIVAEPEVKKAGREQINPYRVFFTWDIHYACNFRCPYCFF